jgi:Ca2+-binding RTX toxin-like protein
LLGGDGNDTLTGGAGNNIFRGGAGADLMTGNNGNDLFQDLVPQGPAADPTSEQEDGSFFDGGDTVYAGSGSDTVYGSAAGDALYGESGADSIFGGDGRDYIDGGDDNDTVDGQGDNDTVIGGFNDDSIMGGDGNDVLSNSDGEADVIDGGDGFDAAQEESALNDQVADVEYFYDLNDDPAPSAPADPNSVSFNLAPAAPVGPAIDVSANGKNVTVYGSNGDDLITATALSGGGLRVTVNSGASGTATRDIAAGVLRVTVFGNSGNDTIDFTNSLATAGSLIDAGGGNDTVRGGPGPDDIIGGPGPTATESDDDLLSGGTGPNVRLEADTLDYAARRRGVFVFLPSSAGEVTSGNGQAGESDRIGAGFEQVFGGRSDDRLLGGARADFLTGGRGGDFMEGGRGDDVIIGYVAGETGVDTLIGGKGKDSLRSKDDAFMDEYEVDAADFTPQIDKGLDKPYVP